MESLFLQNLPLAFRTLSAMPFSPFAHFHTFRLGVIRLGDIRLGVIRLGDLRLGDIRLGDGEGQDEWHRRMRLKWKAIRRRAHPSWLNVSGTSVCAKHLCHPSRRHPSRGHPSRGPPSRGHPSRAIRLRGILRSQIK